MSIILWGLMLALTVVDPAAAGPADEGISQARTIVVQSAGKACGQVQVAPGDATATAVCQVITGDGSQKHVYITSGTAADGQPCVIKTIGADEQELPKIWIGVRMTAVPKPLAAHIGTDGVMISNVVKGSPADEAGLEQYDVVIGFNDKDIKGPQDLSAALADWPAGRTAKLSLLRGGQHKNAAVKPVERTADIQWEMKYDEPEDVFVDNQIKMRGMTLNQGPGGNWVIEELGPLHGMPDMLEKLQQFEFKLGDSEDGKLQFLFNGPDGESQLFHGFGPGCIWQGTGDGDAKVRISISKTDDDGSAIAIQTEDDGRIKVERTDADGNKTSATYENMEQFEAQDPEAAEFFNGTAKADTAFIKVQPFGAEALKLRQDFQINVEEKLQKALERVEAAKARAQEALKRTQTGTGEANEDAAAGADDSILGARVDDGGKTTIYVRGDDGQVRKYQFESVAALQAAEPELYEQVKSMLE